MSKNDLPADWHFRRVFITDESEFLGPGGSYSHIAQPPAIACIARAFFSCLFRRCESSPRHRPHAWHKMSLANGRTEGGGGCNRLACCLHQRRQTTNHPSCEKSPARGCGGGRSRTRGRTRTLFASNAPAASVRCGGMGVRSHHVSCGGPRSLRPLRCMRRRRRRLRHFCALNPNDLGRRDGGRR